MKKAVDSRHAWSLQDKREGQPHGWIQWKGTDLSMDVHCKCGCTSHVESDFVYNVKCPECGTIYFCNGNIELIEVPDGKVSNNVVLAKKED